MLEICSFFRHSICHTYVYALCMGLTIVNIRITKQYVNYFLIDGFKSSFDMWNVDVESKVRCIQIRTKLRIDPGLDSILFSFLTFVRFLFVLRNMPWLKTEQVYMREKENSISGNNNHHISTSFPFQNLFNFILFQFSLYSIRFR